MTRNNENNITDIQGIQVLRDAVKSSAKSYLGAAGNTTLNNMAMERMENTISGKWQQT
jgi:hypothetical protein